MASLNLQAQIRHNAETMKDYFEDLQKWRSAIKEKEATEKMAQRCSMPSARSHADAALPNGCPKESSETLPNVRQQLLLKSKRAAVTDDSTVLSACKNEFVPNREKSPLSAYYAAWDRFNVDEELSKLDDDGSPTDETFRRNEFKMASSPAKRDDESLSFGTRKRDKGMMRAMVKTRDAKNAEAANRSASQVVQQSTCADDVDRVLHSQRAELLDALATNQASLLNYSFSRYRSAVKGFEACVLRLEHQSLCRSLSSSACVKPCPPLVSQWKKIRSIFRTNLGFTQLCLARRGRALDCAASAHRDWAESPFVRLLQAACERSEGNHAQAGRHLQALLVQLRSEEPQTRTHEISEEISKAMSCSSTEELLGTCLSALDTYKFSLLSCTIAIVCDKPETAAAGFARANANCTKKIYQGQHPENLPRTALSEELNITKAQYEREMADPRCNPNSSGTPYSPSGVPLPLRNGYTDEQAKGVPYFLNTPPQNEKGRVRVALGIPLAGPSFTLRNAVSAELSEALALRDKEVLARRRRRQQKVWQRSQDSLRGEESKGKTKEHLSETTPVSKAKEEFPKGTAATKNTKDIPGSATAARFEDSLAVAEEDILLSGTKGPRRGSNTLRKLHIHVMSDNVYMEKEKADNEMQLRH